LIVSLVFTTHQAIFLAFTFSRSSKLRRRTCEHSPRETTEKHLRLLKAKIEKGLNIRLLPELSSSHEKSLRSSRGKVAASGSFAAAKASPSLRRCEQCTKLLMRSTRKVQEEDREASIRHPAISTRREARERREGGRKVELRR